MSMICKTPSKFLFDGLTKGVLTLAKSGMLDSLDQFRVYDPVNCPVDNIDVACLSDIQNDGGEFTVNLKRKSGILSTLDFDAALEWCDVYVNFQSAEYLLTVAYDIEAERETVEDMVARLQKAIELHKKVYLGHRFDPVFQSVVAGYPECLNHVVTRDDLAAIEGYGEAFFAQVNRKPLVTIVAGTSPGCGKFTAAFRAKDMYEKQGERVAVVATEEIWPLLMQDSRVVGFCRNFSDLTVDDEFRYVQSIIGKVAADIRPDRIIVVTQGAFGFNRHATYGVGSSQMQGVTSALIMHAIGADSIILATTWDQMEKMQRMMDYFLLCNVPVDCIFVSPVSPSAGYIGVDMGGFALTGSVTGSVSDVTAWCLGAAARYPWVPVLCDYMNVQEQIDAFKDSPSLREVHADIYINQILGPLVEIKRREQEEHGEEATVALDGAIYDRLPAESEIDISEVKRLARLYKL